MRRTNIQGQVNTGGVIKSGRWPRKWASYRDSGRRGNDKGRTLRDFRKGK